MHIGVGISMTQQSGGFGPASLFTGGQQGVWYDPSDLNTLFQDSAGTTPVTAAGQPVGRMLDKSGRGNHATQSTAGSRPIYGVQPISGRRNLMAVSSQPSASDGTSVTANAAVGPSGQMTAARVSKTDATTPRYVLMGTSMTTQASTVYTLSQYVKYDGYDTTVSLEYNGVANFNVPFIATFNVTASGVSAVTPSLCTSAVTNEGNGWYRVSATFTSAAGPFTPATNPFILSRVTGASGVTVLMTDIQVEVAAAPTAYQNVVSQYNVTEAGVQSVFYLRFDGVDDSMATPTITPGTDKAQVFAGLRKLSDASFGLVLEISADTNTNNGTLLVSAPNNNATTTYAFTPKGTGIAVTSASGYAAPITSVVTGIGDIAANASTLRVNGVQAATSTGLGTGNFLAYPMYIGRRGGASLPFNGSIYGLVVRFGPNLDAATISATETWMNGKTGAY